MNMMSQSPTPQDMVVSDVVPTYDAQDLLQGSVTARIVLNGNVYTLRLTRSGKLILTK